MFDLFGLALLALEQSREVDKTLIHLQLLIVSVYQYLVVLRAHRRCGLVHRRDASTLGDYLSSLGKCLTADELFDWS